MEIEFVSGRTRKIDHLHIHSPRPRLSHNFESLSNLYLFIYFLCKVFRCRDCGEAIEIRDHYTFEIRAIDLLTICRTLARSSKYLE